MTQAEKERAAGTPAFEEDAEAFDAWFAKNPAVFESELLAERRFVTDPENTVSIGCGSGLFEARLGIPRGVEPSEGMARLARKRGIDVRIGTAEEVPLGDETFNGVLLGTVLSYVKDRERAVREAHRILKHGGHVIVSFLPREGSYAMLYELADRKGSYDPETAPAHPYPIPFLEGVHWCSTSEIARLLQAAGFVDLEYVQTLTRHPRYTNDSVEKPREGFDRGDYVVVRARKP
ncbi:MAG: class I SAM-dependent methyltransferase [Verrucomicrobiota bacterium]